MKEKAIPFASGLELLTKACHRPMPAVRLMRHGKKQEQGNQHGAVQKACAVAAGREALIQGRQATTE